MFNFRRFLLLLCCCVLLISVLGSVNAKSPIDTEVNISDATRGETSVVSVKVSDKNGTPVTSIITIDCYYPDNDLFRHIVDKTDDNGYFKTNINWNSKQILGKYKFNISIQPYKGDIYESYNMVKNFDLVEKAQMTIDYSSHANVGSSSTVVVRLSCGDNSRNNFEWLGYRKILFIHDSKSYEVFTNSEGIAVFNFKSDVKGNNKINIFHIGDDKVLGYNKSINIYFKPIADLLITEVKKYKNNYYKVKIKNDGGLKSSTSKLKLWYKSNKYKLVKVGSIGAGKSKIILVKFFSFNLHKKYKKYAVINFGNGVKESNYNNNKVSFKSGDYVRYKADLKVSKVSRVDKFYKVVVVNQGNGGAGKFNVRLVLGSLKSPKDVLVFKVSNFGLFGKFLPANCAVELSIPIFKYFKEKKRFKYIDLNYNKKLLESNYKNNKHKYK